MYTRLTTVPVCLTSLPVGREIRTVRGLKGTVKEVAVKGLMKLVVK